MAWYSSWIPGLPNFNFSIPASIQGRFISFVLKKSLGHLLKPGQLDYRQIDSQIGSGYVQINDLELNSETVNGYLMGLPLTLQAGTISSVKVRIPWPNPLASTLGFSLNAIHLTFCVAPQADVGPSSDVDLTDSVVSVAESFIHEELSAREEETLWQSLHHELAVQPDIDDRSLPGGLDSPSNTSDLHKFDNDPAGISAFASLIERLLARFEFDAQDIKITLIHPHNISLTLSLQDIQYHTDAAGTSDSSSSAETPIRGERHTLSISGVSLSSRDLSVQLERSSLSTSTESPTHSSSAATSRPLSRASSDASMDEETQFTMSQSLAFLPPRPLSPSSSASSSMYESAISNVSSIHPIPDDVDENPTLPSSELEETMMSFGSQPILFKVKTPSPSAPVSEDDPFILSSNSTPSEDQLQIALSIGVISCAVRPWQILGLLHLAHAIAPPQDPMKTKSPQNTSSAGAFPSITARADIRAAVFLLIPMESHQGNNTRTISTQGFFDRPLVPPTLECGYTRIFLGSISSSLSIPNESFMKETKLKSSPATKLSRLISFEISLSDLSIFLFNKPTNNLTTSLVAFPLLITDPHLLVQYPRPHIHRQNDQTQPFLPTFDIIDWEHETSKNFSTRLSHWRCQPPRTSASDRSHIVLEPEVLLSGSSGHPAVRVVGSRSIIAEGDKSMAAENIDDLGMQIAPLHIRVDLQHVLQPEGPLTFFEDLLLSEIPISDEASFSSEITVDRSLVASDRKKPEKQRRSTHTGGAARRSHVVINFHAVRLTIRCPPPPPQSTSRSGALVLDIYDTRISFGSEDSKPSAKFADQDGPRTREWNMFEENVLLKATFNRAVLACSMVNEKTATAFVSIGPLTDEISGQFTAIEENPPSLQPRIVIISPNSNKSDVAPSLALSIDIPSVLVDLSKPVFDSLQYWADDVSQLLEHLTGHDEETEVSNSRDTSLIGSRFFAKSRNGSGSALGSSTSEAAENVIKLSVTEAVVRMLVPRTDTEKSESRPFYINASDLDILVEINPDHKVDLTTPLLRTLVNIILKQQTILTVGVLDLVVENTSKGGNRQKFLALTSPHSLSTTAKSILKLRFSTVTTPETSSKETRIRLTLSGFTYTFFPDLHWISDLLTFVKNPPGTFESVIPSDRTRIFVKISDGSIRVLAPIYPGALVSYMQELEFSTDVIGDSRDSSFHIIATSLALLAIDDTQDQASQGEDTRSTRGISAWTTIGYALLAEASELDTTIINQLATSPLWKVLVERIVLRLHLCADTLTAVSTFGQDLGALFKNPDEEPKPSNRKPAVVGRSAREGTALMSSVEDLAFKRMPEIGPAPDMIYDDLPTNLDYLDESFGAAAGLRELVDEDLDEFDDRAIDTHATTDESIVSRVGGETIKVFDPKGFDLVEDYYLSIPREKSQGTSYSNDATLSVRVLGGTVNLFLYDGYDWGKTRKTIEEEVKEMRKRLAKIRQLVANGQMQDPIVEDTSALLFNSVHIGLDQDEDGFEEPSALIAAIDEELQDDLETASQSSWQSLRQPTSNKPRVRSTRIHGKRLTRSRTPSMEFSLAGLCAEFDQFKPDDPLVSRTFVTVKDLEILDHIKTSTWKKFLTELRSDSRGNVRETDSNMVRIELTGIRPVEGNSSEEVRMRAKILPLRLYVDQDAVDFLKKFFSFKAPASSSPSDASQPSDEGETYIQLGEIFPVDLKLDYKPRRVDYRALKEGRTIELMNFFHFDGAEMTLRHITLAGVTGWARFFEMLNDLWTPDVKATQLAEVISGVAPIRSIVNVGSGVADLILLPIAQYKKDGRIVRGVQKGATAFVKSTAIEAIKMGAKLATGTQVILEQAEGILGGQFEAPITAEPVQLPYGDESGVDDEEDDGTAELISKYAQQPTDLREGIQFAYKSLQRNLNSAAQTILAVPMEVYERSGNEGPVRSVIRAVPIAVLKPMIGASEAVSKTLLGLHNTLDPNIRHDNEAKYKLR